MGQTASKLPPRVVVVYGPPSVGTSTILACLKEASETPLVVVPYAAGEVFENTVERLLTQVDVVFLDVEGGAFETADLQHIHDLRWVIPGHGALIRIWDYPENIIAKAEGHPAYKGSITLDELKEWDKDQLAVETLARALATPLFIIPLIDTEDGIKMVALRAGIKK